MNITNPSMAPSSHPPRDLSRLISFTTSRVGNLVACILMMLGIMVLPQIARAATVSAPAISTPDYPYNTNTILGGEVMILTATVSNPTNTLSYQWQIENPQALGTWDDYAGATATNLSLNPQATIDLFDNYGDASFHLVVNDGGNTVTSAAVAIHVFAGLVPTIVVDTTPALSTTVYAGSYFSYTASFKGTRPIYYQWQKSTDGGGTWNPISGANSPTYTVANAVVGDAGQYRLAATNIIGGILGESGDAVGVSTPATKVVSTGTPQFTWSSIVPFAGLTAEEILTNFPSANKIAGALVGQSSLFGITVTLTNADNQQIVFGPLKHSAWADVTGGVNFTTGANTNGTGNTDFNNVLNAKYYDGGSQTITMTGLIVGQQYQVQLFSLDDGGAYKARRVSWQDPEDVANYSPEYTQGDHAYILGTFTASNSVESIKMNQPDNAANFNALVLRTVGWNPPPYWVKQPASAGGVEGNSGKMSGLAAGDATIPSPEITYQWAMGSGGSYTDLADNTKYSGTHTTTLVISNMAAADAIPDFVLIASNGGGSITSTVAKILIHAPPVPGSLTAYAFSNNPVAYWKLDDTVDPSSGDAVAIDLTGNGRNGTYGPASRNGFNGVLSPQPTNANPIATLFPGFSTNQGAWNNSSGNSSVDSLIRMGPMNIDTNTVNPVDTTITAWIRPTAQPGYAAGILYTRPNAGTSGLFPTAGFGFGNQTLNGSRPLDYVWENGTADNSATYNYNTPFAPPLNTWSFVAVVVEAEKATTYMFYMDTNTMQPVLMSDVNVTHHEPVEWNGAETIIAGDPYGNYGGRVFVGDLSEIGLFRTALSANQLLEMFQAATGVGNIPPSITTQPKSRLAYPGAPVDFVVAGINGTPPFGGYQWLHEGTNLPAENSTTLHFEDPMPINNGAYQFIVTNLYGAATSSVATLNIVPIPATNLIGHWFDGTEDLVNHSTNLPGTHDGIAVGATASNYYFTNDVPPGKTGMAIRFNGGSSIAVANTSTNDAGYVNTFDEGIATSFTVMTWAKGNPGGWAPFVSKYGEGSEGWQLRRNAPWSTTVLMTMRGTGVNDDYGGNTGITGSGQWHHYAGTYDGVTGIRTIIVDGVPDNTPLAGNGLYNLARSAHLTLGGRDNLNGGGPNDGVSYTGGELYDVRIYTAAIPVEQIALISGAQPKMTFTTISGNQFVVTWPFGTLNEATNILGPWVPNVGATSPYTNIVDPGMPEKYIRISNP